MPIGNFAASGIIHPMPSGGSRFGAGVTGLIGLNHPFAH
jgi:hypothetical protein